VLVQLVHLIYPLHFVRNNLSEKVPTTGVQEFVVVLSKFAQKNVSSKAAKKRKEQTKLHIEYMSDLNRCKSNLD